MSNPIRIFVIDDHTLVREAIARLLNDVTDYLVVGTASNGTAALAALSEAQPDVVLVDIMMEGLNAFETVQKIKVMLPSARIAFLTGYIRDRFIARALSVKVDGYISKSERSETLIEAVRNIAGGSVYFSEEVTSRIIVESLGSRATGLSEP